MLNLLILIGCPFTAGFTKYLTLFLEVTMSNSYTELTPPISYLYIACNYKLGMVIKLLHLGLITTYAFFFSYIVIILAMLLVQWKGNECS